MHSLSSAVLATAVDSIVTINVKGLIISVNPATVRTFGYQPEELIGRNVSILMPDPYSAEHDGYLRKYHETGKASIIGVGRRVAARRKNGVVFPVHLAVSEFQQDGEKFFAGIIRDLTELEQVQRQLLQSERLAAIGQMVTGLAHESRNALQRAQACLDMLTLDLADNAEQLDLARRARTALQDLHRLYEEVRSYAAPIHLEFRECDLRTIWRKQWENLAAFKPGRNLTLNEDIEGDCTANIDVHRLEQVFCNIFENAIHVSPDHGVVTVQCRRLTDAGGEIVEITVTDDGPGLSPEATEKIFEPFFTTKQKGTGLGMAIVYRIVVAHGGSMTAGRHPGRGAEIRLRLPAAAPNRNTVR